MDSGKIFLAKLPQGLIGKENTFLLGSLFVAKFQETAMSRQAQEAANRRPFWLYVDEFHNFMTPSMAEILSAARKYRLIAAINAQPSATTISIEALVIWQHKSRHGQTVSAMWRNRA